MAEKVSQGAGLPQLSARAWNRMIDASNWYHQQIAMGGGLAATKTIRPTTTIKLRNNSGQDLRGGEILKIGEHALTDADPLALLFTGLDTTDDCAFGILYRATPSGDYGEALVSGACWAYVNIGSTSDERAAVDAGSHVLESGGSGPIKILWQPGSTGEQKCFVLFEAQGGGTPGYLAVLTQNLTRHASASAAVYTGDIGDESPSGDTITVGDFVLGAGETLLFGTRIMTADFNGKQYVVQAECSPSEDSISELLSALPASGQSSESAGASMSSAASQGAVASSYSMMAYAINYQTSLGDMLANV